MTSKQSRALELRNVDLNRLRNREIILHLQAFELDTDGDREELIYRLQQHILAPEYNQD